MTVHESDRLPTDASDELPASTLEDTSDDVLMQHDDPPETGIQVDEHRWQEILAGFVDDPRGSVQAALELAEDDVSAFLAQLKEQRASMLSSPAGDDDNRTEDLRKTVIAYRDFSRQFAESKPSL